MAVSRASIVSNSYACASDADERHRKDRPDLEQLVGECTYPAGELGLPAFALHRRHRKLHQIRGEREVVACQGMTYGVGRLTVGLKPSGRAAMQLGRPSWVLVAEVGAKDVGEEVVVSPPLPVIVEWDEEQPGALQIDEPRRSARLSRDCIAQRAAQPLENGGGEQEGADLVALEREDLIGEIVDDETVVAREPGDRRARIVAILQGKTGQL